MAVLNKIKRAVRGEVKLTTLALEVLRRSQASLDQRKTSGSARRQKDLCEGWPGAVAVSKEIYHGRKDVMVQPVNNDRP